MFIYTYTLIIYVWIRTFQVVSRGSFALFVATFAGLRAMVWMVCHGIVSVSVGVGWQKENSEALGFRTEQLWNCRLFGLFFAGWKQPVLGWWLFHVLGQRSNHQMSYPSKKRLETKKVLQRWQFGGKSRLVNFVGVIPNYWTRSSDGKVRPWCLKTFSNIMLTIMQKSDGYKHPLLLFMKETTCFCFVGTHGATG